ncbi:hypothetical protein SGPA1_10950 [Streptomyces misionensis JCM 4497]
MARLTSAGPGAKEQRFHTRAVGDLADPRRAPAAPRGSGRGGGGAFAVAGGARRQAEAARRAGAAAASRVSPADRRRHIAARRTVGR